MPINISKIEHRRFTGTTSATANDTSAVKPLIPNDYQSAIRNKIYGLNGIGTYVYSNDNERDGINFPVAVTAGPAVNPAYLVGCRLTDNLFVFAYDDGADGNDGKCYAVSTHGNTSTTRWAIGSRPFTTGSRPATSTTPSDWSMSPPNTTIWAVL